MLEDAELPVPQLPTAVDDVDDDDVGLTEVERDRGTADEPVEPFLRVHVEDKGAARPEMRARGVEQPKPVFEASRWLIES